jgi:SNF2 family DNA or RNA helicase
VSHIYETILYPYQKDAVDRMVDKRQVLLADQPGLGKTLEVLGTLERLGLYDEGVSMILTPIVAAQTAWKDTIDKYVLPNHPKLQLIDLSKGSSVQKTKLLSDTSFDRPTIILANHGAIERAKAARIPGIHDVTLDAIVIDESHLVLPILNDRKITQFWQGLKWFDYVPTRIAVSGTPDRGKLENRYGTYRFLRPGTFAKISRWAWLETYFHTYDKRVSRSRTVKAIGSVRSPVAWASEEDKVIVRRTKHEVLHDLPPKQYRYIELELHKEQRQQYADAVLAMREEQNEAIEDERDTAAAMVFALRGRQISACEWDITDEGRQPKVGGKSAKLDWLLEWLDERGYGNPDVDSGQVVISSQFVQVLYWLQAELKLHGLTAEVLEGSLTSERRASIQRSFQAGQLKIVLLSGRMGVGITLDAADDLILMDIPYDPDMLEQIEDRIHRASNNHQVTIWSLIGVGTIEQLITQKLDLRYKTTRLSMDGRRGVDFERKILSMLRIKMSEPHDSVGV